MKIKNNKEQYLSPEAECFSLKTEGVICASVDFLVDPDPVSDPFTGLEELEW